MLFREIITVYSKNDNKHINILHRQNSESLYVKIGVGYNCALWMYKKISPPH
jgi:hypothetical protein